MLAYAFCSTKKWTELNYTSVAVLKLHHLAMQAWFGYSLNPEQNLWWCDRCTEHTCIVDLWANKGDYSAQVAENHLQCVVSLGGLCFNITLSIPGQVMRPGIGWNASCELVALGLIFYWGGVVHWLFIHVAADIYACSFRWDIIHAWYLNASMLCITKQYYTQNHTCV